MTKIFGHRGAKAYYAENTLLSFEKALDMGADGIELDVHYSKDGEIVVFHDFTLERMTKQTGFIFDYTLHELQSMNVFFKEQVEKIPTLEEVIQLLKNKQSKLNRKLYLNVEFKAGSIQYPNIENKALNLCTKHFPLEQVIYSSFDHYALKKIKELEANAQTGILTTAMLYEPWNYIKKLDADFYHPHFLTLNKESMKMFFENNIKLNPYTVNDVTIAKQLIESKVFGLITDIPDQLISLL